MQNVRFISELSLSRMFDELLAATLDMVSPDHFMKHPGLDKSQRGTKAYGKAASIRKRRIH